MVKPGRAPLLAVVLLILLGLSSCSAGRTDKLGWAIGLRPGECADPTSSIPADDVAQVRRIPCGQAHSMEVYARVPYPVSRLADNPDGSESGLEYPGDDVLHAFGREACADQFRVYLGTAPRQPWYFLTFLYPSAASWTAAQNHRAKLGPLTRLVGKTPVADRSVVCVVRTTGRLLTGSVRTR